MEEVSLGMRILFIAVTVAVGFGVVFVFAASVFRPMRVAGDAMSPAIDDGGWYVMLPTDYSADYRRGELVVIRPPVISDDEVWVRRVIAIAGQTVSWDEMGNVLVDGVILYESYARPQPLSALPDPVVVPAGSVYVLADLRGTVQDSSQPFVGCVKLRQILGKVLFSF